MRGGSDLQIHIYTPKVLALRGRVPPLWLPPLLRLLWHSKSFGCLPPNKVLADKYFVGYIFASLSIIPRVIVSVLLLIPML